MARLTAPAAASAHRRLALALALLAASAPLLVRTALLGPQEGAMAPQQGFWHYAILEEEASATAEASRHLP